MKVFISSPVRGLETYRDAAQHAAEVLGHEVKRSENFVASPQTPQEACLAGVRWADVVVLLLGEHYGEVQPSGRSATHEEFVEAQHESDLIVFLQLGIDPDVQQGSFIEEARSWAGGALTGAFTSERDLEEGVTRALHELELTRQVAPLDENEIAQRAAALVPDRYGFQGPSLWVGVAGGPRRQVLRPAELEDAQLRKALLGELLLGEHALFDTSRGVNTRITEGALHLEQDRASLEIDGLGSVSLTCPAIRDERTGLPTILEEDLSDSIARALRLAAWTLDRIDPVRRITHVAPMVGLLSAGYVGWKTRAEYQADPNTSQAAMGIADPLIVQLAPQVRPRPALTHRVNEMTEDFVVLLRREYKR